MYLDKQLEFFDNENIATNTSIAVVGDNIDTDVTGRAIGDITSLALVVGAKEAVTPGTGKVTVDLLHSNTDGAYATVASLVATANELADGGRVLKLPSGLKRFLQIKVTTATTGAGVNGLSAHIVLDYQRNVAFPSPMQDF